MTQEKMRKVITASVAAGTLFLVVLLSWMVGQWIVIAVQNNRIKKGEEEKARWEEVVAKNEKDVAYYESVFGKDHLAWLQGYVRPSED